MMTMGVSKSSVSTLASISTSCSSSYSSLALKVCAILIFNFILMPLIFAPKASAADVTCECDQLSCAPCEIETGTSFYSAKCGPANARVKSCKKPDCSPVPDQKVCLADLAKKEKSGAELVAGSKDKSPVTGLSASGEVIQLQGAGSVTHANGSKEVVRLNQSVLEGDLFETQADSKIKIRLLDSAEPSGSSQLILNPSSQLKIIIAKFSSQSKQRSVTLQLLSGKVRSRVNQKYDTDDNQFSVRTRSAVAGVRGTDFVTSYSSNDTEWRTEIRTLKGSVMLASASANDAGGKQIEVLRETYAAFVVEAPALNSDDEALQAAIAKGTMTPIGQFDATEASALDEATELKPIASDLEKSPASGSLASGAKEIVSNRMLEKRTPASSIDSVDSICTEPKADFNQCSWICEGNPAGEKRCRVDLPNVACVRRICRANGQWAEPKHLPSNQSELCKPDRPAVGDCGSYW
jgi:hypothetical protein